MHLHGDLLGAISIVVLNGRPVLLHLRQDLLEAASVRSLPSLRATVRSALRGFTMWGVCDTCGYLIGLLIIRGSYYFGVYFKGPPIFANPHVFGNHSPLQ